MSDQKDGEHTVVMQRSVDEAIWKMVKETSTSTVTVRVNPWSPIYMARGFSRKRHRQSVLSLWYQVKLRKSPFLFFGLPFLTIIIGGSFALSSFTTIRYERHDRKIKLMTEEEALKLDKDRRRPDIREEYNVRLLSFTDTATAREGFRQLGTKASDSSER
jgi:Cytochrome c oxidase assembly protein COX16